MRDARRRIEELKREIELEKQIAAHQAELAARKPKPTVDVNRYRALYIDALKTAGRAEMLKQTEAMNNQEPDNGTEEQ